MTLNSCYQKPWTWTNQTQRIVTDRTNQTRQNMTDRTNNTRMNDSVTPKGDHWLSQRYSELHLNTLSKPLRWLSKKCRRRDSNSQPRRPLPGLIPSLILQTARFYARLYYHAQTRAHNLLRQKVITCWVSAIVSYILTDSTIERSSQTNYSTIESLLQY